MPKPIRSVGKVRPEAVVEPAGERNSLAYEMAAEGITSSAEYIAMIDAQVASGKLRDEVASEFKHRLADLIGDRESYTFQEFIDAFSRAAMFLAVDAGFRSSFEFRGKNFDSVSDIKDIVWGKARKSVKLSEDEERILGVMLAGVRGEAAATRETMLADEVERAIVILRRQVLEHLKVKERQREDQMVPGVEPMPIDVEDDSGSPSDMHMDEGALLDSLKASGQHKCCGGRCHSRGG